MPSPIRKPAQAVGRRARYRENAQRYQQLAPQSQEERQVERAVAQFVDLLGGKEALIEALAVGGAGPEVANLLALLVHPNSAKWTVARLCASVGIGPGEFFQILSKARTARAVLEAQDTIARRMGAVVDDVMRRAAPIEVPCPSCAGIGTISPPGQPDAAPLSCGVCRGSGRSVLLPELDRQKVALDLAKLLPKAERPMVAVQNNFGDRTSGSGGGAGTFIQGGIEQLQQAVNDCLFASPPAALPPPVEAEVLPQSEEGDS